MQINARFQSKKKKKGLSVPISVSEDGEREREKEGERGGKNSFFMMLLLFVKRVRR